MDAEQQKLHDYGFVQGKRPYDSEYWELELPGFDSRSEDAIGKRFSVFDYGDDVDSDTSRFGLSVEQGNNRIFINEGNADGVIAMATTLRNMFMTDERTYRPDQVNLNFTYKSTGLEDLAGLLGALANHRCEVSISVRER